MSKSNNILDSKDAQAMLRVLGFEPNQFEKGKPICFHIPLPVDVEAKRDGNAYVLTKKVDVKQEEKPFVDYEREYSIWEVETLLKNMPEDTLIECEDEELGTLQYKLIKLVGTMGKVYELQNIVNDDYINDDFNTFELLNLKFKLVKPRPTGKWIPATKSELLQAVFDNRKVGYNGHVINYPKWNMNFSQRAEYICDNYAEAFNKNQLLIWEETK